MFTEFNKAGTRIAIRRSDDRGLSRIVLGWVPSTLEKGEAFVEKFRFLGGTFSRAAHLASGNSAWTPCVRMFQNGSRTFTVRRLETRAK